MDAIEGEGVGTDGACPAEKSFFVFGVDLETVRMKLRECLAFATGRTQLCGRGRMRFRSWCCCAEGLSLAVCHARPRVALRRGWLSINGEPDKERDIDDDHQRNQFSESD